MMTTIEAILQCPEMALRKIQQYEKKLEYIKQYNRANKDKTLERNRRYYLKMKDSEEYKVKRREYYHNVTKKKLQAKREAEKTEVASPQVLTPKDSAP